MSPTETIPLPTSRGLTAAEVAARVARGQVNRAPRSDWAEYRDIAARNFLTLFNALVVPAAIALFSLGDYRAAWAVSGMAVINTAIGLIQEVRAKRHLDKLAILAEIKARVVRDGQERVIPAGDVVLDDHVLIASGEPVVADGAVLEARFLEIDEALLTGESDPVPRHPGDRLLSGSFCVAGEGTYRADKVGGESFAHQTSAEARRYRYTPSPLQRTIDKIIRILTVLTVVLCGLHVGLHFVRDFGRGDLVRMVAATVTSMVPQGLVLMTTLAFTLGAVRMSRRGAVVQRLSAVESMASVEVLCMDKTGTLTTSRLSLDRVTALDGGEEEARRLLRLFAWGSIDERSKSVQALRAALGEVPGGPPQAVDHLPFKSQNRYSAVRVRAGGEERALVLGAFEALRPLLHGEAAGSAAAVWKELLPSGLRLLLFAEAEGCSTSFNGSLDGYRLRPLALVALSDELRPDAGDVLEALAAQGLRFKILSGDHPETVRATVAHLRLPLAREPVVAGDRLAEAPDREQVIDQYSVFGRVSPQQKLHIVTTLQTQGRRVGMIGDGINDILSIKKADLGIAMGEGSAATRTVAGLVLENNSFELLPATLDEGRTILRNTRRAAMLFLLKNVYTLFLILMAFGVLGLPFPYEPQQVTLLNALTIGVPAFLVMLGKHPSGLPLRPGFLGEVGWFVLSTGLVMGSAGLVVLLVSARALGETEEAQRTVLLTTLVLLGLASVVRLTTVNGQPETSDAALRRWVAVAIGLYLLVMYLPAAGYLDDGTPLSAAHFFQLTPLGVGQWALVLSMIGPALVACLSFDALALAWQRRSASGEPREQIGPSA